MKHLIRQPQARLKIKRAVFQETLPLRGRFEHHLRLQGIGVQIDICEPVKYVMEWIQILVTQARIQREVPVDLPRILKICLQQTCPRFGDG